MRSICSSRYDTVYLFGLVDIRLFFFFKDILLNSEVAPDYQPVSTEVGQKD
jgi:hypothetical protein